MVDRDVLAAFGLTGEPRKLTGGSVDVYRVGDVVLKRIHRTSFENQHSLELAPWLAEQLQVQGDGFRLSRPVRAQAGEWILPDGWMAWSYVEGTPIGPAQVPEAIEAVRRLHEVVREVRPHRLLDENETAWGFAHRHCFGERPAHVHPVLEELVDRLYEHRKPLPQLPCQLIHGDLNRENVLAAPGQPIGFIDFTPFWAPVDFCLAMFANWIGPRLGDVGVLRCFQNIPHFDQLLIRASIRMLLVVSYLEGVKGWEEAPEKRAGEMVLAYLDSRPACSTRLPEVQ